MKNVKLLICYHKPATLFKDDILTPIHVGRANARKRATENDKNFQWMLDNMIGDDTGENISDRNSSYNEMTSLYWAWKNYDELGNPDYVGLMHYRRHFVWREEEYIVYNVDNFNEESYLQEINYFPEKVNEILDGCDFVAHVGKVINVYNHYIENHRKEDLDLAVEIMLEKYPEYVDVTKEYFAGDYSNFCNMFIFSKKIFFEYCEWVFDILEEFEKRADTSEKRFFISERLSGIFVAKLMKNKDLKYKVLPISFIDDPIRIPLALPVNKNNIFQTANLMTSILESAKGNNKFQFYLLYNEKNLESEIDKFNVYKDKYEFCEIEFKYVNLMEEYYPLYISELLSKENKCIYVSANAVVMHDLGEFYRICSTDDYYVVGTSRGKNDAKDLNKKLSQEILVLNSARLRKHQMWDELKDKISNGNDGMKLFNEFCKNQIGYIPWYFVTKESESNHLDAILADGRPRGQIQYETTWRAWMVYDELEPWVNSQGVHSIFWWNNAVKVPMLFNFLNVNKKEVEILYSKQQKEINDYQKPYHNEEGVKTTTGRVKELSKNAVLYYHNYGLKEAMKHAVRKTKSILTGKERFNHE